MMEIERSWIDLTVRPEGEAEIDVNPATGDFEITWRIEDAGGRITLLLRKDAVDRLATRARELLVLL